MIHEWSLAIDRDLKLGDVANSIHVYPTYSTSNMQSAAHIRVEQLLAGTYGRVIRGLARLAWWQGSGAGDPAAASLGCFGVGP